MRVLLCIGAFSIIVILFQGFGSDLMTEKECSVSLKCLEGVSIEFPFQEKFVGTLKNGFGNLEMIFHDDGNFEFKLLNDCRNYSNELGCRDTIMNNYFFSFSLFGTWGELIYEISRRDTICERFNQDNYECCYHGTTGMITGTAKLKILNATADTINGAVNLPLIQTLHDFFLGKEIHFNYSTSCKVVTPTTKRVLSYMYIRLPLDVAVSFTYQEYITFN